MINKNRFSNIVIMLVVFVYIQLIVTLFIASAIQSQPYQQDTMSMQQQLKDEFTSRNVFASR